MEQILHTLHEFVWSRECWHFLLTGIYFTVQSKFYSILRIKQWFGQTLGSLFKNPQVRNTEEIQAVSQFQSFVQHWQQRLVQEISQGLQLR